MATMVDRGLSYRAVYLSGLIPLVATLLRVVSTPTADFSYLVVAGYALLGRAQALQALALSWFFTMLNPGIAAEATNSSVGRYAVLIAAALSVFFRSGSVLRSTRLSRPVVATLLLGIFLVGHSLLFSTIKDISVLKAISWTLAASTILAAWSGLSAKEQEIASRQFFGGLIVLLVCSLFLLPMPVGYLRNGTGFQGVMSHPQAFGPTMALLGAWATGRILSERKPSWWFAALLVACLILVVLSEARTAGISLVLGVVIAIIFAYGSSGGAIRNVLPGLRGKRIYVVAFLALVGLLANGAMFSERLGGYISKSGRADVTTIAEAYELSRGPKIEDMWVNIQDRPFLGIGFGIGSKPEQMVVRRDPMLGLPIGASIEKGVLPMAILEEVGAIGFVLVAVWLYVLLRRAARSRGLTALAVLFVALLINMGESMLFSPGGMGLLVLIMIGWASSPNRDVAL